MKEKSSYDKLQIETRQLAQRLANGDAEAIEEIYRTYYQRLVYYGIQVIGKAHRLEVEDTIQDFFMWLAQHYTKLKKVRDVEVYMFQSIRRNLQSRILGIHHSQRSFERYVERTLPLQETAGHSPEQLYIHQEQQHGQASRIQTELANLPRYQREILYLRYFEDKSYKEIAAILSISDQVAYNYVSRAIKNLKKHLGNFSLLSLFLLAGAGIIG
ncbi:MAG: sigma-70 family RNA polymerase sigma factor [Bacteroidota bacterium]